MYAENIKRIVLWSLIGYVVAFLLLWSFQTDNVVASLELAVLFAMVPYGWHTINKVVGGFGIVGPIYVMIFVLMLKLVAAVFLGWIITPVVLIYNVVMLIIENKKASAVEDSSDAEEQ